MEDMEFAEFVADYDEPVSGEWLAAAFDAIFAPLPDGLLWVELDFDPDDYPVT